MQIIKNHIHSSIGSKLFLYVLGGALLGLGGMSYCFYKALEYRAQKEIEANLAKEVSSIETELGRAEQSMLSLVAGVKALNDLELKDPDVYKQIVFEILKKRSFLTMGAGFGQAAYKIIPDRKFYWPYIYLDQKIPEQVGKPLPFPNNHYLLTDVCELEATCFENHYYTLPVAAGKEVWLEPYNWFGITMTTTTSPVFNNRNELIGVVGLDVNVTALTQAIKKNVISGGGYFFIISEKGNLLAYPPEPQKAKALATYKDIPQLKDVWKQIKTEHDGLVRMHSNYWVFQRVKGTNWLMLAVVPQSVVIVPVLSITVGGALGAGMVLALVVTLFIRQLNKRLQPILEECQNLVEIDAQRTFNLGKNSTMIANSQKSQKFELQSGDEIEILAQSFNRMIAQLKESFENLELQIAERITAELALQGLTQELEQRVIERTQELSQALNNLQQAQIRLVQIEKSATLGQLVAGVAHEINNPVNFIHGNLTHVSEQMEGLLELIKLYQTNYPNPAPEIAHKSDEVDVDFIRVDLPKIISSMTVGTQRIREIVQSFRNFSRHDEAEFKTVDIHDGLNSTLILIDNRLKAKPDYLEIQVIKEYGNLPVVECFAGKMNQVFFNVLSNAIDALEELIRKEQNSFTPPPMIRIRTEVLGGDRITIRIADNGVGISEKIQKQIFDPFFTTKSAGKATGLGMSISYQIVVEQHGGSLYCISSPGKGAEFVIEIPIKQVKISAS